MCCGRLFDPNHIFCNTILSLAICLFSISIDACEQPTIIFPAQHADIDSAKPVISWLPVNGAINYEINMQSRIPEGEVIVQFTTTTTDTKFISATALSRERAVVSVKLKARCGSAGLSPESERIFFVDVRSTCPPPSRLSSAPLGQFIRISWEPNPQFDEVEVRSFGGSPTAPLERVPHTQTFAVIPRSADSTGIVGVRGICKEANSNWQWLSRNN